MSLSGVSERGALANFRSSWGSPGRWRVNLCTPDRRYVFAPLESCEVLERGVAEPRSILPDEFDARFKPGFYAQARAVSADDRRRQTADAATIWKACGRR